MQATWGLEHESSCLKNCIHIQKVTLKQQYFLIAESVIYDYYNLNSAISWIISTRVQKRSSVYYNCYGLKLSKKCFM